MHLQLLYVMEVFNKFLETETLLTEAEFSYVAYILRFRLIEVNAFIV